MKNNELKDLFIRQCNEFSKRHSGEFENYVLNINKTTGDIWSISLDYAAFLNDCSFIMFSVYKNHHLLNHEWDINLFSIFDNRGNEYKVIKSSAQKTYLFWRIIPPIALNANRLVLKIKRICELHDPIFEVLNHIDKNEEDYTVAVKKMNKAVEAFRANPPEFFHYVNIEFDLVLQNLDVEKYVVKEIDVNSLFTLRDKKIYIKKLLVYPNSFEIETKGELKNFSLTYMDEKGQEEKAYPIKRKKGLWIRKTTYYFPIKPDSEDIVKIMNQISTIDPIDYQLLCRSDFSDDKRNGFRIFRG